jgi:hypothetical protein
MGPAGPMGPKRDTGATGPQGPPGLSGLPPANRFTPTQIINGAILTCTSTTGTAGATSCGEPELNGMDIAFAVAAWFTLCAAVNGDIRVGSTLIGSGAAAVPYFIWSGSNWALSSAPATRMTSVSCTLAASVAASRFSTRRIGKQLKMRAR